MRGVKRFEDLDIWQLSVELRDEINRLTDAGPVAKDFAFRNQIRDSASSAPRNIAEGVGRFRPRSVGEGVRNFVCGHSLRSLYAPQPETGNAERRGTGADTC